MTTRIPICRRRTPRELPPHTAGTWTTSAFELPPDLFAVTIIENPSSDPDIEGIYGYADYTPTVILGDLDIDNEVEDTSITAEAFYNGTG